MNTELSAATHFVDRIHEDKYALMQCLVNELAHCLYAMRINAQIQTDAGHYLASIEVDEPTDLAVGCQFRANEIHDLLIHQRNRLVAAINCSLEKLSSIQLQIDLYGTRRTLDGFLWQSLETKSNFINSFMKGDKTLERSGASLDADQMNYAQLKAECSGDKRVLEMVNLQRAIRRLEAQRHAYLRDSRIAENNIKTLESAISDKEKLIAGLSQETFEDVSGENFNYRYGNDVSTKYEEAAEVISHLVNGMKSCEIARIGMIGSAAIELFKGNFKDTLTVIGQFGKYPIELGDVTTSIGRVVINKTRTLIAKRESLILRQQEQIADYQRKIASDTLKVQASFDKMPELIECKTRIAELKRIIAAEASAVGAPQAENQVDAIDVDVAA